MPDPVSLNSRTSNAGDSAPSLNVSFSLPGRLETGADLRFHSAPSTSQPTASTDQTETYVKRYEKEISELIDAFCRDPNLKSGRTESFDFTQTFRGGKQQPVAGYQLTFSDGLTTEVVLRPVKMPSTYADNYEKNALVPEHFPKLYHSQSREGRSQILVLEKLDGYHEWSQSEKFRSALKTEDGLAHCVKDIYGALNSILSQGFAVIDIAPAQGHNVMLMPATGTYRLFDVDTLKVSGDSHAYKFQNIFHHVDPKNETGTAFAFEMIRQYERDYPGALSEAPSAKDRPTYALVRDYTKLKGMPAGWEELITPDDKRFSQANVDYNFGQMPATTPTTGYLKAYERKVFKIDPDILEACNENDLVRFRTLIARNRGELGTTTSAK